MEMVDEYKIPEGYMKNRIGHLVPLEQVDDITKQRETLLESIFIAVQGLAGDMRALKETANDESVAHLSLANGDNVSEQEAGAASITLESFDGSKVWQIVQEPIFIATERVVELQKLIREAVEEFPESARKPLAGLIKAVVNLESGKTVDLKVLKKLRRQKALDSPTWNQAMEVLDECTEQVGTKKYHRFYLRDKDGNKSMIKLNFSSI